MQLKDFFNVLHESFQPPHTYSKRKRPFVKDKKMDKILLIFQRNINISTWCLGLPMIEGNTLLGASSPPNPALHIPDPLSMTRAAISSESAIVTTPF